jgi:YbbR domain-containing protein
MTKSSNFTKSATFIKIFSFFMALILWFFVAGDKQDMPSNEMRLTFSDIPLTWRNLGEDLVVTEIEENVTLYLQGVRKAFEGLTPADLEAYVDLSGKKEGKHEVRINAVAPPGVNVVRIVPNKAKVNLEDLVTKQMSIEYEVAGEPADGLIIDTISLSATDVFINGPRHKVGLIERVLFNVDVNNSNQDITQNAVLYPVDHHNNPIQGVNIMPETIEFKISFTLPQKELPVEPIFSNNGRKVETVKIEPSIVTVKAPKDILAGLKYISTKEIDLKSRGSEFTIEIPLSFPDGVLEISNDTVRLHVVLEPEA